MLGLLEARIVASDVPAFAIAVAVVIAAIALARRLVLSLPERGGYRGQLGLFFFVVMGLLVVLVWLPLEKTVHDNVFTLTGIVLSAAVALSSTTFLGNLIAGGMLRTVSHFKVDDWIQVGDHFGRVTERGLLHTEIQTEDSDLTTLPNLMLATTPVKVVRSTGTVVSAKAGIGYDVPHARVEDSLLRAARNAELDRPFVAVDELGDFAITYRVAGRLDDVDRLLSRRSTLRRAMLDALHQDGIEIMSPTFMNVLQRPKDDTVIPPETGSPRVAAADPESIVFDKARSVKELEECRATAVEMKAKLVEIDGRLGGLEGEEREQLEWERARISGELKTLEGEIAERESRLDT